MKLQHLLQVAIQKPGAGTRKQFKYDKVFGPESNQEQVYEDTQALIRSVLDGMLALSPTHTPAVAYPGATPANCT